MPDKYAGHRVRCSKCGQPFVVPAVQKPAPTPSKPETAFQFALLDTLGLFDALGVLVGMGLAYISLSMN
jgi:hypothetical protein